MKQKVWPITLAAARYPPQRGGPARSWGTQNAGRSSGERTVASRHCFTLSHTNPAAKSPPHFISTWTSVPEGFSYSQLKTYRNINRKLYIPIVRSHESNQKHFSPLASKPQQNADFNQGPWVSRSDCYVLIGSSQGRFPGGGHGNPLQNSCLEKPYGQRSLVGYSLWGCKESDITEQLSTAEHSSAQLTSKDWDVSLEDYVTKKVTDSFCVGFSRKSQIILDSNISFVTY